MCIYIYIYTYIYIFRRQRHEQSPAKPEPHPEALHESCSAAERNAKRSWEAGVVFMLLLGKAGKSCKSEMAYKSGSCRCAMVSQKAQPHQHLSNQCS